MTVHCSLPSDLTTLPALTRPLQVHFSVLSAYCSALQGKMKFTYENRMPDSPESFSVAFAQERFLLQWAWTSATSPGRAKPILSHLTQFAGPRRRLMSSLRPRSHRYHFPNQVTKLVLKPLQRGQADCHPQGILPAIWAQSLRQAPPPSAAGDTQAAFVSIWSPSFPKCQNPQNGSQITIKNRKQRWKRDPNYGEAGGQAGLADGPTPGTWLPLPNAAVLVK